MTVALVLAIAGAGGLLVGVSHLVSQDVVQMQSQAEALARDGNWTAALGFWRQINTSARASAASYLGEGKACLGLGRATQAERALRKAIEAAPGETTACLLLLEILRVEDRPLDAFALPWDTLDEVTPEARQELLHELTLTALTDLPDEKARTTLERWIRADPDDIDARAAYLRRIAAEPRSSDPDRESRLAELTALLDEHQENIAVREALVTGLADAGKPERGRPLLETWPALGRDGRFWRLRGRWDLEHDHRPDQAITAFRAALVDFPQDWRTHYRLARALQNTGQLDEARREAEAVARIRELLDPLTLDPKLDAAFRHLPDPSAFKTLADLCARAGLTRLADAWRSAGAQSEESSSDASSHGAWLPRAQAIAPLPLGMSPSSRSQLLWGNRTCLKETTGAARPHRSHHERPGVVIREERHIRFAGAHRYSGLTSSSSPGSEQVGASRPCRSFTHLSPQQPLPEMM
jgi:thioredoxin-like negative regulator of GroEL